MAVSAINCGAALWLSRVAFKMQTETFGFFFETVAPRSKPMTDLHVKYCVAARLPDIKQLGEAS